MPQLPGEKQPQRKNVPSGTYAIRIGATQLIYRLRESDDPFKDDLNWEKVGERDIDSIPKSTYEGGRWETDSDGDLWFYVEDIKPESDYESKQAKLNESASYSLEFLGPDGREYSFSASMQADIFQEVIEMLIEEYDLSSEINIPFVPGYKNAILNDEPRHPDGSEMERNRSISGGDYYISTAPTKEKKVEYLDEFAETVGGDIKFGTGWDSEDQHNVR